MHIYQNKNKMNIIKKNVVVEISTTVSKFLVFISKFGDSVDSIGEYSEFHDFLPYIKG